MANVINTLYPPVLQTFLPAFINTEAVKIYFSISNYNSSSDFQRIHYSLTKQNNGENVLKNNKTGIAISNCQEDTTNGLYYFTIKPTDIEGNNWEINTYYKIQIRLDSYEGTDVPAVSNTNMLNNYLLTKRSYFSEWSSVGLLLAIPQPDILLSGFDTLATGKSALFHKGIIPISGRMFFGESGSKEELLCKETLQSYKIEIFNNDNLDEPLQSYPIKYTGDSIDPNSINYKIDLQGLNTDDITKFKLVITAVTKNQYSFKKEWYFVLSEYIKDETFHPTITTSVDNENGIVYIRIVNETGLYGILHIKRSTSLNNWENYEILQSVKIDGSIDLTFKDNTVSSLAWYRYSIQLENNKGGLSPIISTGKIIPNFYNAIISRGEKQLAIKYNYTVSSMKPVVNRTKIDTLGGKYPKFVENAILNYKQFSISGTLTAMNDDEELFLSRNNHFGSDYNNYISFNDIENGGQSFGYLNKSTGVFLNKLAYDRNDFFWEREFREKAIEWLNDGEPKLYRSMTEGSLAVMFTDVNLTPNKTLGRRIWDFSATVYEIGDGTSLEVLDKFDIYHVNKIEETNDLSGGGSLAPEQSTVIPGYIDYTSVGSSNIISNIIYPNIQQKYGGVKSSWMPKGCYIKNIKVWFYNKPNVYIKKTNQTLSYVADTSQLKENDLQRVSMGYRLDIMTEGSSSISQIFVNEKGYYQTPDDIKIIYLSIPNEGDKVRIEYVLGYTEQADISTIISASTIDRQVIGQKRGIFKPFSWQGDNIRRKYTYIKTNQYYEKMTYWKGVSLDVEPYAMCNIKWNNDEDYTSYVVGNTGIFNFLKDCPTKDICFIGRRMKQVSQERQPFIREYEFILAKDDYEPTISIPEFTHWGEDNNTNQLGFAFHEDTNKTENSPENPRLNNVYKIGDGYKIYYKYEWYDFDLAEDGTGIARVPIEGSINYTGQVIHSEY